MLAFTQDCGSWFDPAVLEQCGYGWGSTCRLYFRHTRTVNVDLRSYFLEVAASA